MKKHFVVLIYPRRRQQNLNISGDPSLENVQIGGIAGRDLNVTQLQGQVVYATVYDHIHAPDGLSGQAGSIKRLTRNESRQLKVLLNKVKKFWIESVLEQSLYNQVLIELGLEEKSDAIPTRFPGVEEFPEQPGQILSEGTNVTNIFEEMGSGRTLLILGEPGSGKTITLLKLAQSLIERSEENISQPIPVVFNLSSWGQKQQPKQQPLEKWLIEELKDKYQVPKTWSELWLEQKQLILLLDGLDEVRAEQRNACVQALNKFIETHNTVEMVVCSRVKDYEALTERLQLSSALCIKPLSSKQVYSFLDKAGNSLTGLKTLLQQDFELEQFAQTPLILNIMAWAYQGWSAEKLLQQFRTTEDRYRHLFDSYIHRMLHRRVIGQSEKNNNSAQYPQAKVLHWLSWLAKMMVNESQTVFLIEKLQPTLLQSRSERRWYQISNFLLGGLIFRLSLGLIGVLIVVGCFGLNLGPIGVLIFGLTGGEIARLSKEIILFEQMNWSWQRAKSRIDTADELNKLPKGDRQQIERATANQELT